ncbi:hypothetical protein DFJ73DRAFT_894602 [Zopfochytrium polystomum]|nr:hypothetical protein DFJ73DRAFT_894602 [Zopfochytrium polystomum]
MRQPRTVLPLRADMSVSQTAGLPSPTTNGALFFSTRKASGDLPSASSSGYGTLTESAVGSVSTALSLPSPEFSGQNSSLDEFSVRTAVSGSIVEIGQRNTWNAVDVFDGLMDSSSRDVRIDWSIKNAAEKAIAPAAEQPDNRKEPLQSARIDRPVLCFDPLEMTHSLSAPNAGLKPHRINISRLASSGDGHVPQPRTVEINLDAELPASRTAGESYKGTNDSGELLSPVSAVSSNGLHQGRMPLGDPLSEVEYHVLGEEDAFVESLHAIPSPRSSSGLDSKDDASVIDTASLVDIYFWEQPQFARALIATHSSPSAAFEQMPVNTAFDSALDGGDDDDGGRDDGGDHEDADARSIATVLELEFGPMVQLSATEVASHHDLKMDPRLSHISFASSSFSINIDDGTTLSPGSPGPSPPLRSSQATAAAASHGAARSRQTFSLAAGAEVTDTREEQGLQHGSAATAKYRLSAVVQSQSSDAGGFSMAPAEEAAEVHFVQQPVRSNRSSLLLENVDPLEVIAKMARNAGIDESTIRSVCLEHSTKEAAAARLLAIIRGDAEPNPQFRATLTFSLPLQQPAYNAGPAEMQRNYSAHGELLLRMGRLRERIKQISPQPPGYNPEQLLSRKASILSQRGPLRVPTPRPESIQYPPWDPLPLDVDEFSFVDGLQFGEHFDRMDTPHSFHSILPVPAPTPVPTYVPVVDPRNLPSPAALALNLLMIQKPGMVVEGERGSGRSAREYSASRDNATAAAIAAAASHNQAARSPFMYGRLAAMPYLAPSPVPYGAEPHQSIEIARSSGASEFRLSMDHSKGDSIDGFRSGPSQASSRHRYPTTTSVNPAASSNGEGKPKRTLRSMASSTSLRIFNPLRKGRTQPSASSPATATTPSPSSSQGGGIVSATSFGHHPPSLSFAAPVPSHAPPPTSAAPNLPSTALQPAAPAPSSLHQSSNHEEYFAPPPPPPPQFLIRQTASPVPTSSVLAVSHERRATESGPGPRTLPLHDAAQMPANLSPRGSVMTGGPNITDPPAVDPQPPPMRKGSSLRNQQQRSEITLQQRQSIVAAITGVAGPPATPRPRGSVLVGPETRSLDSYCSPPGRRVGAGSRDSLMDHLPTTASPARRINQVAGPRESILDLPSALKQSGSPGASNSPRQRPLSVTFALDPPQTKTVSSAASSILSDSPAPSPPRRPTTPEIASSSSSASTSRSSSPKALLRVASASASPLPGATLSRRSTVSTSPNPPSSPHYSRIWSAQLEPPLITPSSSISSSYSHQVSLINPLVPLPVPSLRQLGAKPTTPVMAGSAMALYAPMAAAAQAQAVAQAHAQLAYAGAQPEPQRRARALSVDTPRRACTPGAARPRSLRVAGTALGAIKAYAQPSAAVTAAAAAAAFATGSAAAGAGSSSTSSAAAPAPYLPPSYAPPAGIMGRRGSNATSIRLSLDDDDAENRPGSPSTQFRVHREPASPFAGWTGGLLKVRRSTDGGGAIGSSGGGGNGSAGSLRPSLQSPPPGMGPMARAVGDGPGVGGGVGRGLDAVGASLVGSGMGSIGLGGGGVRHQRKTSAATVSGFGSGGDVGLAAFVGGGGGGGSGGGGPSEERGRSFSVSESGGGDGKGHGARSWSMIRRRGPLAG